MTTASCMEKTNIRYVTPEQIEEPAAFVSIDVSFISLTKVLPPVRELMTEDGEIVCLINHSSRRAGRGRQEGRRARSEVHEEVIEKVIEFRYRRSGWRAGSWNFLRSKDRREISSICCIF